MYFTGITDALKKNAHDQNEQTTHQLGSWNISEVINENNRRTLGTSVCENTVGF